MTEPRHAQYTDTSAPMTPDNQRNEPSMTPAFGYPQVTDDRQDLQSRVPGQATDQDPPNRRHLQDQLTRSEAVTPPNDDPPDTEFNPDDYEYVRVGGVVRAIPKSSVQVEPETATQSVPAAAMVEVVDPHFYVWLADGNVIRVKQSDLPTSAGTNAQYGHWQIDEKVYQIVNVFPVEDIDKTFVKGDQK